jgi:hypothetical protein
MEACLSRTSVTLLGRWLIRVWFMINIRRT